jgi:type I restriction enzyme M protein
VAGLSYHGAAVRPIEISMSEQSPQILQKLWSHFQILRNDGLSYRDFVEQLTFLLFLKMAHERTLPPRNQPSAVPQDFGWPSLLERESDALEVHYRRLLLELGKQPGLPGVLFIRAQDRIRNPAKLRRLILDIDREQWSSLEASVQGEIFEELLERSSREGTSLSFTPRPLIQTIVDVLRLRPDETLCDPACGTGGFLVGAYEWFLARSGGELAAELAPRVRCGTYFGQELVSRPRRLALMNLCLHGLEPEIKLGDSIYAPPGDRRFDMVLTNPPFGNKGANQVPRRPDLTIATSNKQLNFLQHVLTLLKPGGRAAVVVPDNCLFADQAGEVFKVITQDCDLHTVLRLPNGTFTPYSAGTKTNVVFFTKGRPTETVWVYDARTNVPRITKKDRPLTHAHLAAFEACYGTDPDGRARRSPGDSMEDRWRSFPISEIRARDFKIDSLKWLRDESLDDEDLSEPEDLIEEATTWLQAALSNLEGIRDTLAGESSPKRPQVVRGV